MASNASAFVTALGNGSRGAGLSALGHYGGGLSALLNAGAARTAASSAADAERFTAMQVAARDRRATRQAVGAARAATAGTGAALDEFAMPLIADIEHRGASDEAMAILGGDTRASQLLARGRSDALAGVHDANASLLRGASFSGWKGAKSTTPVWHDGTTGDFAFQER
jgi:hypothetical protein